MKEVIVVVMCVLLASCQEVPSDRRIDNTVKLTVHDYGTVYNVNNVQAFRIIEIDGCQYIYDGGMNTSVITHKGNCSNPIHRQLSSDGQHAILIGDTTQSFKVGNVTITESVCYP